VYQWTPSVDFSSNAVKECFILKQNHNFGVSKVEFPPLKDFFSVIAKTKAPPT
jgi:hypothetical protein